MFNGFEIDMLSLGDADCLVVTEWNSQYGPCRVLIDGGCSSDAGVIKDFLLGRGYNHFYAVLCTHAHDDHASGLIELVKDPAFTFTNAWMHDINSHISAYSLRSASAGNSSQAEGVRQVIETTKELAGAFSSRGLVPREPFAGEYISTSWPHLVVLGPSRPFYKNVLADFTKVDVPNSFLSSGLWAAGAQAGLAGKPASLSSLEWLLSQPPAKYPSIFAPPTENLSMQVPLAGLLGNSSVKETPTTQPFNNTSVILGSIFGGNRLLFTADAGADALDDVAPEWKSLTWMQVPHHGSEGNLSQTNIERFHPKNAYISCCGDSSHPSRAIVSGLIKAGAQVFSTHQSGHLCFSLGNVPPRGGYSPAVPLKGTGNPEPVFNWLAGWAGTTR
jgi:beta-lactamase superfamily II metal-dependent hydrolase